MNKGPYKVGTNGDTWYVERVGGDWIGTAHGEVEAHDFADELNRLDGTLRQARACLLNLQPDSGPVAQQMQKMIHEITISLRDTR
jgi:hypothetical protein